MNTDRPNIILIVCDQLRFDSIGAYGNGLVDTPNIDSLAARATRFEHAYSAVPSCIPARATLMTGQDQWHAGILGMGWGQGQMPDDYPHTLASELTAAGYQTHIANTSGCRALIRNSSLTWTMTQPNVAIFRTIRKAQAR